MSFILSVPMIVKVCVSLALILVVNRFSGSLIAAVLAGTLLLAFWAGHSVGSFSHIAWERLSHRDNLFLLLIIILVIWMSGQMAESGIMNSLVTSFQSRVSNRASMAMLPAVVGLLPMPGGALFSAPLVDDCDPGKSVDPVIKGRINYWFRHIWEYWWPLYAGVLLAAELAGIQLWHMIAAGIPVTLFSILGGWIFLLRRVEKREKSRTGRFDLNALVPVFIVIAIYALLEIFFPAASGISKYFPIAVGIIAAMIYLQIRKPITAGQWKKIILSWKTLSLAVIVAVIRIYGAFMEAPLPDGEFIVNYHASGAGGGRGSRPSSHHDHSFYFRIYDGNCAGNGRSQFSHRDAACRN